MERFVERASLDYTANIREGPSLDNLPFQMVDSGKTRTDLADIQAADDVLSRHEAGPQQTQPQPAAVSNQKAPWKFFSIEKRKKSQKETPR